MQKTYVIENNTPPTNIGLNQMSNNSSLSDFVEEADGENVDLLSDFIKEADGENVDLTDDYNNML